MVVCVQISACILISYSVLIFQCPCFSLGNVLVWDLKPDISVVERFPQKLCFRGLDLCVATNI